LLCGVNMGIKGLVERRMLLSVKRFI